MANPAGTVSRAEASSSGGSTNSEAGGTGSMVASIVSDAVGTITAIIVGVEKVLEVAITAGAAVFRCNKITATAATAIIRIINTALKNLIGYSILGHILSYFLIIIHF
jgi:hypothetical protein